MREENGDYLKLLALVRNMRDAQLRFFRTRKQTHLQEAKDWERRVDALLIEAGAFDPDLFRSV